MVGEPVTRPSQSGYVLLVVLLLVSLLVGLTVTYARSAVLAGEQLPFTQKKVAGQSGMDSGLAFARKLLLEQGPTTTSVPGPAGSPVTISIDEPDPTLRAIDVSIDSGRTVSALAEVRLAPGGALPTLTAEARTAVSESPDTDIVYTDQQYRNTTVNGILLVSKGQTITLADTIVKGAIVSQNAMSDEAWSEGDRITILIEDSVLMEPGGVLAQCSIIAPDARIRLRNQPRWQAHGVVVADTVATEDVTARARWHREVLARDIVDATADMIALNTDRAPMAWPDALTTGAQAITRLVFDRPAAQPDEKTAIAGFDFGPAQTGGP